MGDNFYEDNDAFDEALEPPQETASVLMSEAMRRINKAKLYETLISHNLFGDGCNDEIVGEVQSEIQQFVLGRLNNLLGIKSETTSESIVNNQFTVEEAEFLKMLAQRGIAKSSLANPSSVPTIVPAQIRTTQINPVLAPKNITPVVRTPKRGNVTVDSEGRRLYKKQTVSRKIQPMPMPSLNESNALMAGMAAKGLMKVSNENVTSGATAAPTATPMGDNPLLNALIQASVSKNANVKED